METKLVSNEFLKVRSISDFLQLWLEGDHIQGAERDTLLRYYGSYVNHFGVYIKHHYAEQTRELFDELSASNSKEILEVGCGCGTESLWLAMQGYSVKAIDVADDLLEVANVRKNILEKQLGRALPCTFEKRSLLDIKDEKYDIIWIEQAFHHIEPRDKVLTKLGGLLRSGGKLIVSEANAWNPAIQATLFKGRGFKTIIDHYGVQWGNERIITARKLVKSFQKQGITKKSVRYFRFLPNKPWVDWIVSRFGIIDKHEFGIIKPLYTHYNYVGVKE